MHIVLEYQSSTTKDYGTQLPADVWRQRETHLVSDAGEPDQLMYDVGADVAQATDVEGGRVTRLKTADRRVTGERWTQAVSRQLHNTEWTRTAHWFRYKWN